MNAALAAALAAAQRDEVKRRLRTQEEISPTRAIIDGRESVLFSGNDYLGLSRHERVTTAAADAARRFGASATASRLINGNHELYAGLESTLAAFKGHEAALIFPTGYMANLAVLSTLAGAGDEIFIDRLDHASIYDGVALSGARMRRYKHGDVAGLAKMLSEHSSQPDRQRLIFTDGVFSMDGDIAPLAELRALADEYDCLLIVDDAHGTGVIGPDGRGSCAAAGITADVEIGTLSKALGSLGGFVTCDAAVTDYLVNRARPFIFTTGLPPASLAAAATALEVSQDEPWRRERVTALAARLRAELSAAGFAVPAGDTPIIPVLVGDEERAVRLSERLLDAGVFVPAIRTPSVPRGSARLRLTVSAAHSDAEVDLAIAALVDAGKTLDVI